MNKIAVKNKLVAKQMLTPSRIREQLSIISQILVYEKYDYMYKVICIRKFVDSHPLDLRF